VNTVAVAGVAAVAYRDESGSIIAACGAGRLDPGPGCTDPA